MKTSSFLFEKGTLSEKAKPGQSVSDDYNLILAFGGKDQVANKDCYELLRERFSGAIIVTCSTAGQIYDHEVLDEVVSVVALKFEKTRLETAKINMSEFESSYDAGSALVKMLPGDQLKHIFILSDGSLVNGSELVKGIKSALPASISVTGGLAGDGANFQSTVVGLNETPKNGNIVAIGFYGDNLSIGIGSMGGWEPFGLERTVTKASANQLFEIDNMNALQLYREYLGKYANELPGAALLFPLSIRLPETDDVVVRTILSIDNDRQSMIFAGDMPIGAKVKFMKANFDKLIDAASSAAQDCMLEAKDHRPELAILISCVGRRLILAKRADEEVEAVSEVFGDKTLVTGFYSYGEISPANYTADCQLHNQTMTITTFSEL